MRYIRMKSIKSMKAYLNKPEILIIFVYLVCFAAGLHSVYTEIDAIALLNKLPDFCIFKRLTGYKCPGCGMTRAFISLGRFQFTDAFQYNIFAPFLFYGGLLWLTPLRKMKCKSNNKIHYSVFSIVIVYWIARNVNLIS